MSAFEAINDFSRQPAPKRRRLPKYVHSEKSRHGVECFYFRKSKELPRIRLRSRPGSEEFLAEYRDALSGKSAPPQSFIYFARAGNKVKIGISKNPRQRLGGIRTGNSNRVSIYYVTPGDMALERELHRLFASDRVNGEWFIYSGQIRSWIEEDEAKRRAS